MQLIETIRTCNRRLENITHHNERMNRSRATLFNEDVKIDLKKIITIPTDLPPTLHKCRVLYGPDVQQVEFIPYHRKNVTSFQLVTADHLSYHHKFADRLHLQSLLQNSPADEIIIVKNGYLTDASYANLCFFDGKKWLTPASPLLPGTMRAKLLKLGKIKEADLRPADLPFFKKLKLINAMLGFHHSPALGIEKIKN